MMRSLYSGISGLRNHQTRMDVIGNNIANVNTTGYKTSRVIFQDIFSQTVSGGMASNPGVSGGTNPSQVGLGIKLSTIDVLHTRSAFARTDNEFDMMVDGDGFFIVGYATAWDTEGNPIDFDKFYTRAGNFGLDDQGYLTTSDGYFVLGYASEIIYTQGTAASGNDPEIPPSLSFGAVGTALSPIRLNIDEFSTFFEAGGTTPMATPPNDIDLPIELSGFSVGEDGSVSVFLNNRKQVVGKISLATFSNPGGLEKAGNSLYRQTSSSGNAIETEADTDGAGKIIGGGLEMSNVDLATEFTDMIVTQRGFQANSRIITVSDSMLEELVNLKR